MKKSEIFILILYYIIFVFAVIFICISQTPVTYNFISHSNVSYLFLQLYLTHMSHIYFLQPHENVILIFISQSVN